MRPGSGPRLAIIIPTYRTDPIARQALTTLAAMGSEEICIHVGDNSEDPDKHAFLKDLEHRSRNVTVDCHATNIGAERNWLGLVRAQSAPLICLAADDDSFLPSYFARASELMEADGACGAACGLLISVAAEDGSDVPSLYSPPERTERDPVDRVRRFVGQNAIAYAVNRTELVKAFADYVEANPLKSAFNDYLLAFHILSAGTFRVDRRGRAYIYDNDAWHTPAAALRSRAKFYVSCGLPSGFAHLERIHWAVANAHFFSSRFRAPTLSDDDAQRVGAALFERMVIDFRQEQKAAPAEIDQLFAGHGGARTALNRLAGSSYNGSMRVFDLFAEVVAPFSGDLAERYHAFLVETLANPAPATGSILQTIKARLRGRG